MNTYKFLDNAGFVHDIAFCLDLPEAMDYAVKRDLLPCTIVDCGPARFELWAGMPQ